MPRSDENSEALRRAEAAEAIARGENEGMAVSPIADDDGTPKPPVFKDKAQAFDAGVNAGYQQCLNDMTDMLERQSSVHQQRMRGVRVNL